MVSFCLVGSSSYHYQLRLTSLSNRVLPFVVTPRTPAQPEPEYVVARLPERRNVIRTCHEDKEICSWLSKQRALPRGSLRPTALVWTLPWVYTYSCFFLSPYLRQIWKLQADGQTASKHKWRTRRIIAHCTKPFKANKNLSEGPFLHIRWLSDHLVCAIKLGGLARATSYRRIRQIIVEAHIAAFFLFFGRFPVPSLPAHDLKDARELASTRLLLHTSYELDFLNMWGESTNSSRILLDKAGGCTRLGTTGIIIYQLRNCIYSYQEAELYRNVARLSEESQQW